MRLDVRRVDRWCIDGANALDGCVEVIEGMLLDESRDLGGDATERL